MSALEQLKIYVNVMQHGCPENPKDDFEAGWNAAKAFWARELKGVIRMMEMEDIENAVK